MAELVKEHSQKDPEEQPLTQAAEAVNPKADKEVTDAGVETLHENHSIQQASTHPDIQPAGSAVPAPEGISSEMGKFNNEKPENAILDIQRDIAAKSTDGNSLGKYTKIVNFLRKKVLGGERNAA